MTDLDRQPNNARSDMSLSEYRFVLYFGILALAVTSIPYVVGAVMADGERIFGGFVYAISDCYSYLAKMRQGAEGAWLFHIPYTPEPHPGAVLYTFRRLLGKVAALLPGSDLTTRMVWVYHVARWVFGLGLLVTVYHFIATFAQRKGTRRLAWLMATFGGGLGWLLIALGHPDWLGSLPLDFILPEGFTFLVLFAFPHLALAQSLLLWGLLVLLRSWRAQVGRLNCLTRDLQTEPIPCRSTAGPVYWTAATRAGLLWLFMGLVVPFYPAVAWAIAGAAWIALTLHKRRPCLPQAGSLVTAAIISAPTVIYGAWRFTSDPVYATWQAQSRVLSPHPLHYLAAYGLPLALAALGVRSALRCGQPTWLPVAWVGVVPLLVYLPIGEQRRLAVGVQVPLSLLAAMGLDKLTDLRSRTLSLRLRLATAIVLAVIVPTNALLIAGSTMALRGQPEPIFRDRHEMQAMDWLSERTDLTDVVLASYATGNYLPARVGARAFIGHGAESVEFDEKRAEVARFFDAETSDAWREGLLERYGIDYVFWGPAERSLGGFDPGTASCLRPAYGVGEYTVFVVELPG